MQSTVFTAVTEGLEAFNVTMHLHHPTHHSILVVDPESDFLEWVQRQLTTPETQLFTASNSRDAYQLFLDHSPDLIISELHLQPDSGLELLSKIRQITPHALVILNSAFGSTQAVIESMKLGAFDFIRKEELPFNLKVVVQEALRTKTDRDRASTTKPQLTIEQHKDSIVGQSPAMQQVFKMIGRVAPSDAPVMITGESGTGKELVASAIHHYGRRSPNIFLAINCAAIPENLLESEIFGHEKGAFSGAIAQKIGRFEQADSGTLFLDEIGDMPMSLQSKLLRVLQNGEFSRVGGTRTLRADVRILAATNRNLEKDIQQKRFREDLFYRLNVVHIHLPALRERKEDILLLAEYFLQRISQRKRLPHFKLSADAAKLLETHSWPGNVRELENTLERASVLTHSNIILPHEIPFTTSEISLQSAGASTPSATASGSPLSPEACIQFLLDYALKTPEEPLLPWLEREFTRFAMEKTDHNQVRAAKLLGITRATLRKRLEKL